MAKNEEGVQCTSEQKINYTYCTGSCLGIAKPVVKDVKGFKFRLIFFLVTINEIRRLTRVGSKKHFSEYYIAF